MSEMTYDEFRRYILGGQDYYPPLAFYALRCGVLIDGVPRIRYELMIFDLSNAIPALEMLRDKEYTYADVVSFDAPLTPIIAYRMDSESGWQKEGANE